MTEFSTKLLARHGPWLCVLAHLELAREYVRWGCGCPRGNDRR